MAEYTQQVEQAQTMPIMSPTALKVVLKERADLVEHWLESCLNAHGIPSSLQQAMEYSLLAGGKRVRPVLCLTSAALVGGVFNDVLPFAAAIEMIHTYSLIHDDLPAMDDDDLRRGKPSSHKQFGEAMAILAGDALLTDAFTFMTSVPFAAQNVLRAVNYMAKAAGASGMVGGQVLDMAYTGKQGFSLDALRTMHSMKTGAIIRASCVCGGLLVGADSAVLHALEEYGAALGTAFQIADDILDITADTATLGKPAGSDVSMGKSTYPALVGLEESKRLAHMYKNKAVESLGTLGGEEADFLRGLATYVVERAF